MPDQPAIIETSIRSHILPTRRISFRREEKNRLVQIRIEDKAINVSAEELALAVRTVTEN